MELCGSENGVVLPCTGAQHVVSVLWSPTRVITCTATWQALPRIRQAGILPGPAQIGRAHSQLLMWLSVKGFHLIPTGKPKKGVRLCYEQ